MKRSKRYSAVAEKVKPGLNRSCLEAVRLVKETASAKFEESVELAMKLDIKKGVSVRNTIVLPHSFGREKQVLVFARGEKEREAREAGAAFVGNDDLIKKIKGGWLDFDIAVATPDMMREVGSLGPILGRRGMMPNPKSQTVTMDLKGAIAALKQGRVEFRSDKTGVIHLPIGTVKMEEQQLVDNISTVITEVQQRKPSETKGEFVKSISLSATMGPGVAMVLDKEV